jgi:hypothetical protein
MATFAAEHCISTAPDGATGIGGCEQESHHRPHGQVVEVIPNERCLRCAHPKLVLQGRESSWFVFDADKAMADAQLSGSHLCRSPLPATEKGDVQASLLQEANAETIPHIEAFAQLACGIEPETPIGQNAIHIKHQQLHGAQSLP